MDNGEERIPVDETLVEFRSPAAFARKRLKTAVFSPTTANARGKCKDAWMDSENAATRNLMEGCGFGEDTGKKLLASFVDEDMRPELIDPALPGQAMVLDDLAAVHTMTNCHSTTSMAVIGKVLAGAGITNPGDLGDLSSDERKHRALQVMAARYMDLKVIEENQSTTLVAGSFATELLRACYASPAVIVEHVEPFLEKRGFMIFPIEKTDCVANRRLVTIRIQRAMAKEYEYAPPPTALIRLRREIRAEGRDVSNAEEFEAVAARFFALGEIERQRREAESAQKKRKRGIGGDITGAESSGGASARGGMGIGGGITGAESDSEGRAAPDLEVVDGPSKDVWSNWSAAEVARYVLTQSPMAWEAVPSEDQVKLVVQWRLDGAGLAKGTDGGWSDDLSGKLGIEDGVTKDIVVPILQRLTKARASFAAGAKKYDGTGGGDKMEISFGKAGRAVCGRDIVRKPSQRTMWHGEPVMWMDVNAAIHDDNGDGDASALMVERFGILIGSKSVPGGSGVRFLRQAANRDIGDSWISVDQAAEALAMIADYWEVQRTAGKPIDLLAVLADVSDTERSVSAARSPKKERAKHDTKDISEVLEECAARRASNLDGDYPTSFTSDGIQDGTDMRTYLNAVNGGGKSLRNVSVHEAEADCLRLTKTKLQAYDCDPSHTQIIEIQNFSLTMTNLACLNPVKREFGMLSTSHKSTKTYLTHTDGEMELKEVESDGRKQKNIVTPKQAMFALRRCLDIWATKHGPAYGNARYLEFLGMFDDVMQKTLASDSVKPLAEIITIAWQHMHGELMAATRKVQLAGKFQHAGVELGAVSAIPDGWSSLRQEVIFDCRLDWIEERVKKSESGGGGGSGGGGRNKGGRGRAGRGRLEGDDNADADAGGAVSDVEKKALEKHGFPSIPAAKRSFLKENGNKSKCWWACSKVGVALGGCHFKDCKFSDSHPKKSNTKDG